MRDSRITSSGRWATRMICVPSCISFVTAAASAGRLPASRPAKGSSRIRIFGAGRSAGRSAASGSRRWIGSGCRGRGGGEGPGSPQDGPWRPVPGPRPSGEQLLRGELVPPAAEKTLVLAKLRAPGSPPGVRRRHNRSASLRPPGRDGSIFPRTCGQSPWMALARADFPEPLGPRIAQFSPVGSPRMSRGGASGLPGAA